MLPYFLILIICTVLAALAHRFRGVPFLSGVLLLLLFLVLVIPAGIRDLSVGSDTFNYRDIFIYKRGALSLAHFIGGIEPGFVIFQNIMQHLTTSFTLYLFSIATLVIGLHLRIFKKLSAHLGISIFVFIALGVYLFFFNGARQAMAASIYGFAIFALLDKKPLKYLLITLLAITFHKSAIIMLPMYFVLVMPFSPKQFLLLVLFTFFFTNGLSILMNLAPDLVHQKYANYNNRTSGGGVILMVVYSAMTFVFFLFRGTINKADLRKYDVFLNYAIFTSLVYIMVNLFGQDVNLIRFTLYASFGFVLIWPIVLKDVPLFKSIIPWSFFVISHLIFFYIYISKMITPYFVNPDLL